MIGLLSFHESSSYGAILQCYALQTAVEERGLKCEFIDYKRQPVSTSQLGGSWKYKIKRYCLNGIATVKQAVLKSELRKKSAAFDAFKKQNLHVSTQSYHTFEDLRDASLSYDAVIVGSDQVWNPVTTGDNLKIYGLGFLPEGVKRISYAASIGLGQLTANQEKQLEECVGNLDYYSCREQIGAELLSGVLGKEIEHVLDPTFLLDQEKWRVVEKKVKTPQKYVLAYLLGSMSYERELAKKIAEELGAGLLIVRESPKDMFSAHGIGGLGPDEMLYLIDHAEYVVTDSFHGTALSINFRKNFLCCNRRGYEKATSYASRLTNLLHTLGLEASQANEGDWREKAGKITDYHDAEQKIEEMIIRSNNYLDSALSINV